MADGIANQYLPPEQQEIAGQGASHAGQNPDEQRGKADLNEIGTHQRISFIWSSLMLASLMSASPWAAPASDRWWRSHQR
jgi:hypothetical protein